MSHERRIVIAGEGRAGLETAERLDDRGHTVTIIEVDEDRAEAEYTDIVDAIILPQQEAADTAVDLLSGEAVRTVVSGPELTVPEIEVAETAPFAGRTLSEVSLPEGALVVSDADRTEVPVADEIRMLFRG